MHDEIRETYLETAYGATLELLATGEAREATRGIILDQWTALRPNEANDILEDALKDALASGVEREDIDPSWF